MCRVVDLKQAVLAKNESAAHALRTELTARGTTVVNLLSSPGSGKTALLERELGLARERGVPVAALTADLATENDALRLARSGFPSSRCSPTGSATSGRDARTAPRRLAARGHPDPVRGERRQPRLPRLVRPRRITARRPRLGDGGEDKPLKYPTAYGLAQLVVVTKTDIAQAVEFDEAAFRAHVQQVNPGVEVVLTSARRGEGGGVLLDRALAVGSGGPVHAPVMARQPTAHHHHHTEAPGHDHAPGHHHAPGAGHGPGHEHGPGHDHGPGPGTGPGHHGPGSASRAVHPHSGVVPTR